MRAQRGDQAAALLTDHPLFLVPLIHHRQLKVDKELLLRELNLLDVDDVDLAVDIPEKEKAGGEVKRDDGVVVLGLEVDHAGRLIG